MAVASRYRRDEGMERTKSAPDPDEEAAVEAAVKAMRETGGDAYSQAYAAISAWVKCRAKIQAGLRIPENLVFNLGDARLRGVVEAALPVIGAAIVNIDPEKPLFALDKEQVIDVLVTSFAAISDVGLRFEETDDWPFSDGIPF